MAGHNLHDPLRPGVTPPRRRSEPRECRRQILQPRPERDYAAAIDRDRKVVRVESTPASHLREHPLLDWMLLHMIAGQGPGVVARERKHPGVFARTIVV